MYTAQKIAQIYPHYQHVFPSLPKMNQYIKHNIVCPFVSYFSTFSDNVDDLDDDNDGILDIHDEDDDGDGIKDLEVKLANIEFNVLI